MDVNGVGLADLGLQTDLKQNKKHTPIFLHTCCCCDYEWSSPDHRSTCVVCGISNYSERCAGVPSPPQVAGGAMNPRPGLTTGPGPAG